MSKCFICEQDKQCGKMFKNINNRIKEVDVCPDCKSTTCCLCSEKLTDKEMKLNDGFTFTRILPKTYENSKFCLKCLTDKVMQIFISQGKDEINRINFDHDYSDCKRCKQPNDSKDEITGHLTARFCKKCRIKFGDQMKLKLRSDSVNDVPDSRSERKIF